jgi:hypothetical protein
LLTPFSFLLPSVCRPYNQGARLTAYELVVENIPATLLADSAAAALLTLGDVDAVVVGADRVAANGDTANKIGTSMLALAAAATGVPFFVAAPTSSIDPSVATGAGIVIEQRASSELTHSISHKDVRVAAEGIEVWNPAFDVTAAKDITGASPMERTQSALETGSGLRAILRFAVIRVRSFVHSSSTAHAQGWRRIAESFNSNQALSKQSRTPRVYRQWSACVLSCRNLHGARPHPQGGRRHLQRSRILRQTRPPKVWRP